MEFILHRAQGMPYEFDWAVKDDYSGNDYSHKESSDGDLVKGEYRVLLPDGRTQIVTYTATDKTGFVAKVRYEGKATFGNSFGNKRNNNNGNNGLNKYGGSHNNKINGGITSSGGSYSGGFTNNGGSYNNGNNGGITSSGGSYHNGNNGGITSSGGSYNNGNNGGITSSGGNYNNGNNGGITSSTGSYNGGNFNKNVGGSDIISQNNRRIAGGSNYVR